MSIWLRLVVYTTVIFLVLVVYLGQRETTAAATLRAAARKTVKFVAYTVLAVAVMLGLEWMFVD